MLETEREAKRLMSDPSSWSQGGIRRKAYRAMALTPEEESPRGKSSRKGKKKHVHKWGAWELLRTEWRYGYTFNPKTGSYRRNRSPAPLYVLERVCKKCGLRDQCRSGSKGGPVGGRRRYWL